ncbi:site-specific integrase [Carboxylicivirga linearis]|uniref:Site-specific integrase n=1 Tax=Carboxylicivirga linearis TaxID=1628157 RepID=A0ABS5K3V0_9BACT|nr:site-specific integrase [Carboxylicivirga linearis]MBS2101184.1 site-specific integrase [Carboxylicivirga linearis]
MSKLENDTWILFYIKRSKLLKNGDAPIFVRITVNKVRAEFGLKKSVVPDLWNESKQRVKGKSTSAEDINAAIEKTIKKIEATTTYLSMQDVELTSELIKENIVGKKEDRRTILKIFKTHNENARKLIGIDFAEDTVERYETSFMHTKNFIKWQYKREDMPLDQINPHFISNYELYFKTVRNCSHNTTVKYLKNFKKIVRIALSNDWIKKDPFVNIKLILEPVDPVFLTNEELLTIINKKITIKRIEQVRDVFVFCCFTGLAFSDVKTLRSKHFSLENDVDTWINKKRTKTGQLSTVLVLDAAKRLLEKYKNHPDVTEKGMLLPVISNQKTNQYLKEIADICGIDKNISSHSARHTFATTVLLENDVPIEVVSKALGHSNIKITQHYARTTQKLIKRNMEKIKSLY